MTRRCIVAGIGEVLWDEFPEGRQLGGAPANVAFHAQQLGGEGIVVSAVGDDPDGASVREQVARNGLSTNYLQTDTAHPTGTVSVEVDSTGTPTYVIHTDVAWDNIQQTDALTEFARSADAICFGSLAQRSKLSHDTIQNVLRKTRADCLRVFDVNLRQHYYTAETVEQSLALCDVFKLNHEELPTIAKMLDISSAGVEAVIHELLTRFSISMIALTRAENGSALYTKSQTSDLPGGNGPKPVDTVGAGDSFTATLITGLLKLPDIAGISSEDLLRIHRNASQVAAYVCSQPGATPALPAELVAAVG